jgi:hypothetical protein
MDKKQAVITETFTRKQLLEMDADKLAELVGKATRPGSTSFGQAVVRKADGTIKYDNPERAGTYGENED